MEYTYFLHEEKYTKGYYGVLNDECSCSGFAFEFESESGQQPPR